MNLNHTFGRNPNLLKFSADTRPATARHDFGYSIDHLSKTEQKNRTKSSTAEVLNLVKTQIFKTPEDILAYYSIAGQEYHYSQIDYPRIKFVEPLEDTFMSSLLITFISSHFRFYVDLSSKSDVIHKGKINVSKTRDLFDLVSDFNGQGSNVFTKFQYFTQFCRSSNLSISGPHSLDSFDTIRVLLQNEFDKHKSEDVIIYCQDCKEIPSSKVKVNSKLVEKATNSEATLSIPYQPRWAIASRYNQYYPIIIRNNLESDALYYCTELHHFGSLKSICYSGSKIVFICYSLREDSCPPIEK